MVNLLLFIIASNKMSFFAFYSIVFVPADSHLAVSYFTSVALHFIIYKMKELEKDRGGQKNLSSDFRSATY